MQMTFDDYINNPMGNKNAVISHREMFRMIYMAKLDKILVRETGKINYKLYKSADKYYIHMKIPSEVIDRFYYDVVIEFYTDKNELKLSRSLTNYYVKFYSNDPSFVYTFAHAMLENDMFIRDLVPRMSKEAVKQVAVVKNPKNQMGYVKSLYFTYLICRQRGLFNKIKFDSEAQIYHQKLLLSQVEHATKKVQDREEAGKDLNKGKKKNTTNSRELKKVDINNGVDNSLFTKRTSNISTNKPILASQDIHKINKPNNKIISGGNIKSIKSTRSSSDIDKIKFVKHK